MIVRKLFDIESEWIYKIMQRNVEITSVSLLRRTTLKESIFWGTVHNKNKDEYLRMKILSFKVWRHSIYNWLK